MVTITYAPLGPQYGAMQSLHYVQDNAVWLNMIYVKLTKDIYGLLKSVLLFYQKFIDDLKSYSSSFVINPCTPCVIKAIIGNNQMTVTWHVDDLKVSHIEPFQVTKFATYLATIYGKGLVVHCRPIHDYLGMNLNFSQPCIVKISMIKYMTKVINDFPETITTTCTTPAADHLFTVHDKQEAKFLPEQQTPSLPSQCCATLIPLQMHTMQHPNSHLLPHHLHKMTRQR
jgi:hypothetical protein